LNSEGPSGLNRLDDVQFLAEQEQKKMNNTNRKKGRRIEKVNRK
jgi:hypothetical protein